MLNPFGSYRYKAILKNQKPAKAEVDLDEFFVNLWGKVVMIISDVAQEFDAKWQQRKRVIDSLLLVFLIFRLVFSKNSQGYGTTIEEFWHNCLRMQFPLPQKKPISASSFSEARKKLNEDIFKVLNQKIIVAHNTVTEPDDQSQRWLNYRLFAVDGSKLNLPRELIDQDYRTPSKEAYYPQGLLSSLYQLKSKVAYDFDLVNHGNERQCALAHLKTLTTNDVVVYDRGYFSYAMLIIILRRAFIPFFAYRKTPSKRLMTLETVRRLIKSSRYYLPKRPNVRFVNTTRISSSKHSPSD